jgi:hypothetical protein
MLCLSRLLTMLSLRHFRSGERTILIDVFATNMPEEVTFFTLIDLPSCRMDHDLIYGSMRFPAPNSQSDKVFYYRDYSHVSTILIILIGLQFTARLMSIHGTTCT